MDPEILKELSKASHREFTTGFYYGKTTSQDQNYETSAYVKDYTFTGLVKDYNESSGYAVVEQRNKMEIGDKIEFFGPDGKSFSQVLTSMKDLESGEDLMSAPHAKQMLLIKTEQPVSANYLLRRKEK